MAKLVSKTYGDALFALAVEEHMVDQLYEEAQAVAQILRENTELTRLMNHPKIEKEEKELTVMVDQMNKEIAWRQGRIAVLKELYKTNFEKIEESKSP